MSKFAETPLFTWTNCPNARRAVYVIRRGDDTPADPYQKDWYSACYLEVCWEAADTWAWRVWPRLHLGTGRCYAGEAATRREAEVAAGISAIYVLKDLDEVEEDQIIASAAGRKLSIKPRQPHANTAAV